MVVAVLGTVSASAQFYVGGSLGYSTNTNEHTEHPSSEKTTKTTEQTALLTVAPDLGFALSEKFEVGLEFGFESETDKKSSEDESVSGHDKRESGWEIAPYARYECLSAEKFSVWAQVVLGYGVKAEENTTFSVQFAPVLKYSLSHHVKLISRVNFLSIGFASTSSKEKEGEKQITNFGVGVNKFHGATASGGLFTVGFEYEF
ncbi:hypothetical protein AGMMS49965_13940 [Bacteroidia bacterium]|nr:hypothetical protein AGMMS49965_13940 [Bacteroidia bacterium]